jgi:hypothetical protein
MSARLRQALEQVARRVRRVRLWGGLAACWLVLALLGGAIAALGPMPGMSDVPPVWRPALLALLAAMMGMACALAAIRSARDPRWVARRIEFRHPDLGTELLAAVDEVESAKDGRLGYLQETVVREALDHRRFHNWDETVPTWLLRSVKLAHAACLVLLAVVIANLAMQARSTAYGGSRPTSRADSSEVQVEPGDVELERGSPLLVVARFNRSAPADATLVLEGDVQGSNRRAMTRSLEDPTFAGRVDSVQSELVYRIDFDGRSTVNYRVKVFEYPELRRADAHLVFPGYTGLAPKVVEDIRHVTAVEGTELTLICRLNKDVTSAAMVDKEGQTVALARDESQPHTYRARMTLTDPKRYTVKLVDAQGRSNPNEAEIAVNVTRNQPPTVTVTQPSHDVEVSPLEELRLKAKMEDDFGVVRHGLSYALGGGQPKEVVFEAPKAPASQSNARPALKLDAEHMLDFEAMQAEPDQLVSYVFWAEDVGPDGAVRRASSDMFFAEVRPFEEIFRQGEQPPAGSAEMEGEQNQNAQDAGRLAELQKQIVAATWKLIRRETRPQPTRDFAADSKTLHDSQKAVIEQAAPLGERLRDATSRANLEAAVNAMKQAEKHLGRAADGPSIPALGPALTAEQTAYQALLKLRAREFQIIRSRSQRGGRSSGGRSQRQMQQLDLKPDENRFEEQRTARSQQNQTRREREQAEDRQVLNRLRELAQRQRDLNERLKELQSALEAAKTPETREEIERQLKRLREQQQEILRDTDELRERMEREENQQRMDQARQQVELSRDHLRQASRALQENRLPQAITEGARAGQQLNDVREQLRKDTANRFAEEMTQLRSEARKLDEDQKKINQQLEAWEKKPERSLRESPERKQVREEAGQQTKRLDDVLDRMRNTTQEAEDTEPLLARGLYDAVRKANEQKVPEAVKTTQQLVDMGIPEEASKTARRAGEGIEQLRQGVERAAESVLGDETAALRRAQGELDDLADQVNREIARNQPKDAPQGRPAGNQPGQQPSADPFDQLEMIGQRDEPGQTPGQSERQGQRPGDRRQGQEGQPQAQQKGQDGHPRDGQQQGQAGNQRQQQGGQQQGQAGNQRQQGQGQQQGQAGGQRQQGQGQQQGQADNQRNPDGQAGGGRDGSRANRNLDQVAEGMQNGGLGGPHGPITGEGFRQWSDRMRDVEELLDDPEWRAEAARIRDRVRGAREDVRRHAKEPDWNRLQDLVTRPINELRQRISEELRRRESPDALVPIDRDPVPPQFAEGVRRYYERLGSGR